VGRNEEFCLCGWGFIKDFMGELPTLVDLIDHVHFAIEANLEFS